MYYKITCHSKVGGQYFFCK